MCVLSLSESFAAPWAVARQAPLSMGFSRQEHWSELPRPPPGDLLNPGIELRFPTLQADSLPSESPGKPRVTSLEAPSPNTATLEFRVSVYAFWGDPFSQ